MGSLNLKVFKTLNFKSFAKTHFHPTGYTGTEYIGCLQLILK